jgi:molybdate/tungstate transport system ATP-binding protein
VITVSSLAIQMGSFSLENISFEIPDGGYAALMGRTGAGKTTILEAICGLRSVVSGTIELAGRDVTSLKPAERGIGYVPQDGALFSTMSIRDHLAFSLVIRKWSKSAIDSRVAELVELLGIAHLLDRKPAGLSGGEEQRVSLGRALAFRPAILCLDEPLSALDDQTRAEMYELLAHVRQHTGVTTLHITHNQSEAASLADQLLVLEDGQITSRPNA